MNDSTVQYYIDHLHLEPHVEGGYFAETYRSPDVVQVYRDGQAEPLVRNACTEIYFLLRGEDFSAFHRLKSDEMWHFYDGWGLTLHLIEAEGAYRAVHMGKDLERGEVFQTVLPAGCWFGATLDAPGAFALVGCSVAPGFDYQDFELADRAALLAAYPQHAVIITRLTRA
jgi:predicted cupin superfamily sugar epimerase